MQCPSTLNTIYFRRVMNWDTAFINCKNNAKEAEKAIDNDHKYEQLNHYLKVF